MWPFRFGKSLPARHGNLRQEGARAALITLSCINLLNFADRYVLGAVKSPLKKDLHLTDAQTSLPMTGMLIVYMLSALVFGWIADMRIIDRRVMLASGVAFWSLATALAGFAQNFAQLLVFRSLIGVGEAAFTTIVLPLLADFYPIADRNMAFMVFGLTGPLGGALGFAAGAVFGSMFSWRAAFFVCGVPGLVIASLILTLNDPSPGINDPSEMKEGVEHLNGGAPEGERRRSWVARQSAFADVRDIFAVPHWCIAVIGMVAATFTIGGLSDWYATYLLRNVKGTSMGKAGLVLSACTMLGGVGGTFLGSEVSQALNRRLHNAYLLVPALFMIPTAIFLFLCVNVTISQYLCYLFAISAWIFFFTYTAPLNCVQYNSMPVHLRARAGAISVLLMHVLGDVISPPIIGAISDATGSLKLGMQLCWIMPVVAGLAWGIGSVVLKPLPEASNDASPKADRKSVV